MTFVVEPFDRNRHDRSQFSSGQPSLDRYLQKQASQDLKRSVAAVFVLVGEPSVRVMGYYTLSAYTVELTQLDGAAAKRLPSYPLLPATLLGRLAVDEGCQGQGLGALLLMDGLRRSLRATEQVASMAVVAEAIDEAAVGFYLKWGFLRFEGEAMKLYLPMRLLKGLF